MTPAGDSRRSVLLLAADNAGAAQPPDLCSAARPGPVQTVSLARRHAHRPARPCDVTTCTYFFCCLFFRTAVIILLAATT